MNDLEHIENISQIQPFVICIIVNKKCQDFKIPNDSHSNKQSEKFDANNQFLNNSNQDNTLDTSKFCPIFPSFYQIWVPHSYF